jgi:predicted dehydrogenase
MIQVAVIGAGHWGPNLIRNFNNRLSSVVTWVVDVDQSRLEQVKLRFPDVRTATDAHAAISDPGVQAVVITTPTSTHYPLAKMALNAGKHVLVEKPITDQVQHGEELVELAERSDRVLLVGHVFIYNAAVQQVKKYLEADALGRIFYISMVRTNLGPIRIDVNAAWDLASHDVSIVNFWLGAEPISASAVGGVYINAGVEDAVFATLRYPNDVLVNLHASWLNPKKAREITVVGDKQMMTFDDMNLNEPVRIYDKQVSDARVKPPYVDSFATFRASVRDGSVVIPRIVMGEPLKTECDHFIACIENRSRPMFDARASVGVVRALATIARSVKNHGKEEEVRK